MKNRRALSLSIPMLLIAVALIGCSDDAQQGANNIYFQPNNSLPDCEEPGDFDMARDLDGPGDPDMPGDLDMANNPDSGVTTDSGTNPCIEPDMGSDSGTDTGTETDTSNDTGTETDTGTDMEEDATVDMPPDMEPEIIVDVCEFPDGGTYTGNCDVVRATGCSGAQECLISQQVVGDTVIQIGMCRVPDQSHTLGEFENCNGTVERCGLGLTCFFGTCRKLCYPADGTGCLDENQFCRQPSASWPGLGYCASQCVGPG